MRGLADPAGDVLSRLADDDLELLLLIRTFELALLELFATGAVSGTTHVCLGQEYIPVALEPLLRQDFVFSNHRGHGHYLARFRDPSGLLAEITGRTGAVCHGVGGSQHIYRDGFLSTGVQGESLPVAVGVGLHFKLTGVPRIAAAFLGDGTWGEGAVYEALNLAGLWDVPLLVVVEHNGIAQSTPTELQMAGTVAARAAAFGLAYHRISSMDINVIRAELAGRLDELRTSHRPLVVEFDTVRLGPHSKGDDTRDDDQLRHARKRDWYPRYLARHPDQVGELEQKVRRRVDALIEENSQRQPSTWDQTWR
jgi:TPP-dependent pyruvate/acetoin dehydrogenase alpha subunit